MDVRRKETLQRDRRILGLSILIALAAFVIDLEAPHGIAVSVFYLIPVVLCLWSSRKEHILRIVLLGTLLAFIGFFLPPPEDLRAALFNRACALLVIWTTAALTMRFKRSELARIEEQRKAADRLAQVLEGAPDAMIITDGGGIIRQLNSTGETLFGYDRGELIGQPVERLVPGPLRTRHRGHRRDYHRDPRRRPMGLGMPLTAVRKDGSVFPIEATLGTLRSGSETSVICAVRDVSERRQMEQQLQQAQKMEAIGRLAGGIAHDFKNILTAIMSFTHFAKDALAPDEPVHADLDEVLEAAARAADLTKQLLVYSRRQIIEPRIVNLNERVEGMDRMLRRILGDDVDLAVLADPDVSSIRADPGQLDQVLVNLVVNARESTPRGGRLVVETANVSLDDVTLRQHEQIPPGDYVMLAVSDTGVGMTDEVKARLFEPFFTTKHAQGGTGLGLSVCYGIVKQAGGYIHVYSEAGKGSTLKVYFPRVTRPAEPPAPQARPPAVLSGTETILLAEDEPTVRTLTARALEEAGYTVIESEGGRHAARRFEEHRERIALLLTDVVLRDMNGRELAERVEALKPGTPVIFMSGYTDNVIGRNGVLEQGVVFIQKRFRPEALLRKIRMVLDAADHPD